MEITKENAKELIRECKLSDELYKQFIRHGEQDLKIPQIKKINMSGTTINMSSEVLLDVNSEDFYIGKTKIVVEEFNDSSRGLLFKNAYDKSVCLFVTDSSFNEFIVGFIKMFNPLSTVELKRMINFKIQCEIALILANQKPLFPSNLLSDEDKVNKLLAREHLDFLNFSDCDKEYLEKNKKFFKLCEDKDTEIYYVEKDSDDYFYDLMCVIKDNIPLLIPVPIVKRIMSLESEENINMSTVTKQNGKDVYSSNFIHYNQSEEFLNQFKTFFELRDL